MKLEDLQVYNMAMELGEEIWKIVKTWDYFAKDTVGKQLIRAVDSVAANLSEGFGRFHYNENRQFCYYSRGSLFETRTWIAKASQRDLIKADCTRMLKDSIDKLSLKLNNYIKTIGKNN
jgi:four helix bundle protein